MPEHLVSRAAVVAEARTWIGTRWQHQARLKGVAADCVGLVIGTCKALDLLPAGFDISNYGRVPDGRELIATCEAHLLRVAVDATQPGDIVVMRFEREPQHVGIIGNYPQAGELSLIHSHAAVRKATEHRLDSVWRSRIVAVYNIPGVAA